MTYDVTYEDCKEFVEERARRWRKDITGEIAQENILYEYNESSLAEAERLNVMITLIEWEVEHDKLTPELSDELYLYYQDYKEGRLDGILGDDEEDTVIKVLTTLFRKVFPEEG